MTENKEKASLGCGTLILVALIVLIFSRGSDDEVKSAVRDLDRKLTHIMEHLDISDTQSSITNTNPKADTTNRINE